MTSNEVTIINLAAHRIGAGQRISSRTEKSELARVANDCWDIARDECLQSANWPFATRYVVLDLVGGTLTKPYNHDWQFAYRWPSDCIKARRIVSRLGQFDTKTDPVPFAEASDTQGRLILTSFMFRRQSFVDFITRESGQSDVPTWPVHLEYTGHVTDAGQFDACFASMLAWRLAIDFAPSLSRIKGAIEAATEAFENAKSSAGAAAFNGQVSVPDPDSVLIRSRG